MYVCMRLSGLSVLQSRLSQAELTELLDNYASYNEGKGAAEAQQ